MRIQAREYQHIAVQSVFDYFNRATGNPVVAMPTGTGKSIVIAMLMEQILTQWPNQRIMVLTHVKELIEQNAKRMLDVWPTAPIGIYSAGLKTRQTYMPITFGGIASVVKVAEAFEHIDLLLIDECHLLSGKADSMYMTLIEKLKERNPYLKVIGLSATPYRMGQGMITDGGIFTELCINMTDLVSFNWFIEQGYLSTLIPKVTETYVNVTDVGMSNGDYAPGELQTATEKVTYGALREAIEHAADRHKWLVFCAGNQNAEHAAQILNSFGIPATFVHSGVSSADRDARIQGFKDGFYRAITNNNVLTTGFDEPGIDCIIVLRKTMSPGLWVQMLGRGTRPLYHYAYDLSTQNGRLAAIYYGGKQNCLVLDFARNTRDLGPINDPILPRVKGQMGGEAPVKICSDDKMVGRKGCGTYNHASVRYCVDCGAEFEHGVNFSQHAGSDQIIASEAPVFEWFNVSTIILRKHIAKGSGLPTLKVTYQCRATNGIQSKFFDEYLGFEHKGLMLHKAHNWWKARHQEEPPETVDEVIAKKAELRTPRKIRVWINRRYPEIINYEYE